MRRAIGVLIGAGLASAGCAISSSTCSINQTSVSSSRYFKVFTTVARENIAQRFSPTSDVTVSNARIYISKVGTFTLSTETLSLLIYPTNAGNTAPDMTTALATAADGYQARYLATGANLITFTFSSSASLTSGTSYWLVLNAGNLTASDTHYVRWHGSSADADTNHISKYQDSMGNWLLGTTSGGTDPFDLAYQLGCSS